VLILLAIRVAVSFASFTGERQAAGLGLFGLILLILLVLAGGFIFWLWRKRSS
jgi:hypothetical protein